LGYPDGEQIPLDLMIDVIGRIAAAVDLPVSADLESGYGDVAETVRRAIGVGAVGANLEDAMRPLGESVAAVSAAVGAGEAEGIRFVLNARTDAFLKAGDRDPEAVLVDAIERGRAFLDAGAACVFVPGKLDVPTVERLVAGIGERKVSLIGVPGSVPSSDLQRLGVAQGAVLWSLEPAGRAHGPAGSQRRPPGRRGAAGGDSSPELSTEMSAEVSAFRVLASQLLSPPPRQSGKSLSAIPAPEEDNGVMSPPAPRRRLPASPFNAARDAIPPDEVFAVGDRVAHDRHGLGRIVSVSGTMAVDADFGSGSRRVSTPNAKMHKL